jgi:YesN/AraC family two-component response regulator
MMPGKDGYQLCRELKNDFRTNHIPIVLLTARADTASRITGLEHGADAYLSKPFDKKELLVCLNNLFVQREKLRIKYRSHFSEQNQEWQTEGLNEQFLKKVIRNLEQNYRNDKYGIDNLYHELSISRVQLHRKLTALTGLSASNFIRNYRLEKARNLLLQSEKNVSEIAYEVGFTDPNYFSRTFSLEYGLSPSEMRKSFH